MQPALQSIRTVPDLCGLADAGDVSPDVIAALAQIISSIEELQNRRCQEVDATTMIMLLAAARSRGALAPVPSDAEIGQRSKDLIAALDRGDVSAVDAALAPSFIQFLDGNAYDRDAILPSLEYHRSHGPDITTRVWDDERVVHKDGALVFTGKAHEVQRGNEAHGCYTYDGSYLVQWVHVGNAWRVQLLTWQKKRSDREWFDEIFRKKCGFSREPNGLLVDVVKDTKPGTALDLAMGQGRNALYLASQGWSVTGVDISNEGLRIAREQAAERALTIQTINADLDEYELGTSRFDLVTMFYVGEDARWIDKIKASLCHGGLFVLEGWARETPDSRFGFGEGQLAKLFDGFEILRDEIVDGTPDWAWDTGRLARFVARKN